MLLRITLLAIAIGVVSANHPASAQQSTQDKFWQDIQNLNWQLSGQGKIASRAYVQIPSNYGFLSSDGTRKFVVLMGNLPRNNSYTLAPNDLHWFSIFTYEDTGHISDDEKIDADAILATLKEQNVKLNDERKKQGIEQLFLDGWYYPPHYDLGTKRLEWATKLHQSNGEVVVNLSTRLLGRTGVMNALLVTDPKTLDADTREFKAALTGFGFDSGQTYTEFRSGDKIAEYGLSGLIIGGAAAVAAKAGFFKAIGKFGIYIFGGLIAAVGGLLRKLFRSNNTA